MKHLFPGLPYLALLLLLTIASCKKDEGGTPVSNCRIDTVTDSIFGGTAALTYNAQGQITQLVYKQPGAGELERRVFSYTGTEVEERVYLAGAENPADTWRYRLGPNGFAASRVYADSGSLSYRDSTLYTYNDQGYLTGLVLWRRNSSTGSMQKLADLSIMVENGNTRAILNKANQDTLFAYSYEPGYANTFKVERVFPQFSHFLLQSPGFQPDGINFLTGKPNRHLFTTARTSDNNRLRFIRVKRSSDQLVAALTAEWTTPSTVTIHRFNLGYDCP